MDTLGSGEPDRQPTSPTLKHKLSLSSAPSAPSYPPKPSLTIRPSTQKTSYQPISPTTPIESTLPPTNDNPLVDSPLQYILPNRILQKASYPSASVYPRLNGAPLEGSTASLDNPYRPPLYNHITTSTIPVHRPRLDRSSSGESHRQSLSSGGGGNGGSELGGWGPRASRIYHPYASHAPAASEPQRLNLHRPVSRSKYHRPGPFYPPEASSTPQPPVSASPGTFADTASHPFSLDPPSPPPNMYNSRSSASRQSCQDPISAPSAFNPNPSQSSSPTEYDMNPADIPQPARQMYSIPPYGQPSYGPGTPNATFAAPSYESSVQPRHSVDHTFQHSVRPSTSYHGSYPFYPALPPYGSSSSSSVYPTHTRPSTGEPSPSFMRRSLPGHHSSADKPSSDTFAHSIPPQPQVRTSGSADSPAGNAYFWSYEQNPARSESYGYPP